MSELKEPLIINSEQYREYVWDDYTYRIDCPLKVYIAESGSHRVVDGESVVHYIPDNWRLIRWKAWEGQPEVIA